VEESNCANIAPAAHTFFAVVSRLYEEFIISPTVHQLLCDIAKYDVLVPATSMIDRINDIMHDVVNTTVEQSHLLFMILVFMMLCE
jgi:hypothetical protein